MRAAFIIAACALAGCSRTTPPARAFQIQSRTDLIGGKRALADVGDFKITNGVVQAIVQNKGTSRGFGAFGGSLIDIDLVRSADSSPTKGPAGNDYFTEMFPAFFLTAVEPSTVEVANDAETGVAKIVVSGGSGAFISVTKAITDLVFPKEALTYTCEYILEPGKQYLKLVTTVTNPGTEPVTFPLSIPFGFITLLGEGQRLFVPGQAGFDMRFHLEDTVYKRNADLQALPGEVTSMWTSEGEGVSYAVAAGRTPQGGYMEGKTQFYPTARPDSILIPIASSSFLGSYWAKSPETLGPKQSFSYTGYLAVGSGDVASVQRVVYDIRDVRTSPRGETVLRDKTPFVNVSGLVREANTNRPLGNISVVLQNEAGEYVTQANTLPNGLYSAPVPPGRYRAYAVDSVRSLAKSELIDVPADGEGNIDLTLEQAGDVRVIVRDEKGQPIPAKVSFEAVADSPSLGALPRRFLYDLKVGERYRRSDFVTDDPADPQTRRYLEKVLYARDGTAGSALRPGTYTVWASRGIEYSLEKREVEVTTGRTITVGFTLQHVLPTKGWVSADFHVHSVKSVDSDMELDDRVTSFAVEGVDLMTSTDHNMVADYAPTIEALQLQEWLRSVVGLELTSLEMGHFNAFPIKLQPGPIQHGSFRWFYRPPGELFAQLRGLGDPGKVIVQVNHPRDTILGYFNAFDIGTYTGQPLPAASSLIVLDKAPQPTGEKSPYDPSNFSLDFDVLEVFNGKRIDNMFGTRVPTTPRPGPEPALPACPADGNLTVACLPKPGEFIEKPIKYKDASGVDRIIVQPAFPGAQEEWFTLLGQGKRIVATGNSDSHGASAEAGLPRTYLDIGASADGSMQALDVDAAMDALRRGKALVTNGPIITATIDDQGPGSTVVNANGNFRLVVKVEAAPWIDVTRVVVRRGGKDQGKRPEVLATIDVPATTEVLRLESTQLFTGIPDDSFFVVEAFGERSMFPVFAPYEIPSLQISDAVGVIGGAFGFGSTYGKYEPQFAQIVKPYAFTNPIFATRTRKQALSVPKRVMPVSNAEPFHPRQLPDLRTLFHAFHSDPE